MRNFGRENGHFSRKKRHSEILVREIFVQFPPNSAPGLCNFIYTYFLWQFLSFFFKQTTFQRTFCATCRL